MTRLTLIIILLLTLAVPPAVKRTPCYTVSTALAEACMCKARGRKPVTVPMWVCEAVNR